MWGKKINEERRAAFYRAARLVFCTAAVWAAVPGITVQECKGQTVSTVPRPRPQEDLRDLLEQMCEEGRETDAALALEYYEQLAAAPLNLNRAGREDLERLLVLTDFQIESLLEYRREHGDILSGTELSLLSGFTEETVRLIRPYVVFDTGNRRMLSSGRFAKDCRTDVLLKMRRVLEREEWYAPVTQEELDRKPESRYLGTPFYMQLKYKCEYMDRAQWGFTLENDAGERFLSPARIPAGDFLSFHLALKNLGADRRRKFIISTLVLGDFSVRFGQGLTLWNSFNLVPGDNPQGIYKKGSFVVPYTSSDENNYFRGAAVCCTAGKLNLCLLGSYTRRDASVSGDTYTSLITGGIHNTAGTLRTRKTLNETVAGARISRRFRRWKAGVSATVYGYDKKNGRKVSEYNKFQMYDGMWGNVGADFYGVMGRVRMFGEGAADFGGHLALLLGAVFPAGERCEIGISARSYSKAYIAPHAGAYCTGSGCFNQTGIFFNALVRFGRNVRLTVNTDVVHYPWMRYNTDAPSNAVKEALKLSYKSNRANVYIRCSAGYDDYSRLCRSSVRLGGKRRMGERFEAGGRAEAVFASKAPAGWSAGAEGSYRSPKGNFRLAVQGAWFVAPAWESRLYLYENDLPQSFVSRLLYGKGFCAYILARFRFGRGLEGTMKLDTMSYPGGDKTGKSHLGLGIRWRPGRKY